MDRDDVRCRELGGDGRFAAEPLAARLPSLTSRKGFATRKPAVTARIEGRQILLGEAGEREHVGLGAIETSTAPARVSKSRWR